MAQVKDKGLSEEEKSSSEETVVMNKKVSFGHNGSRVGWGWMRPQLDIVEVLWDGPSTRVTIPEIQLGQINITEISDREES